MSQGRPVPAAIFAALEAAALTTALVHAVRGARAYERYRRAETPQEAALHRRATVDADRVRNASLGAGAVVWAVNLWDVVRAERKRRPSTARAGGRSAAFR
jgi:hypothetical protein